MSENREIMETEIIEEYAVFVFDVYFLYRMHCKGEGKNRIASA
jgi:hypothetical protein